LAAIAPSPPAAPPPVSRPTPVAWRDSALAVGAALLIGLGLVWLLAYFILGVSPAFIIGLVRAAISPPRTTSDVTAPPVVKLTVWANGLSVPTSLTFGTNGRLYVAELSG
jgi:hypothetical protein